MSINPFDDDSGSFFCLGQRRRAAAACGRALPTCLTAGVWCSEKPTARPVSSTSSRTGPISGRRVSGTGWRRARIFGADALVGKAHR